MTTVKEQSSIFLEQLMGRVRKPAKAASVKAYRSHLNKWILPLLGDKELSRVGNADIKAVIRTLSEARLSAASINAIFNTIKMIVASAIDDEGNRTSERTWNPDFINLPVVNRLTQDAPTVSVLATETAISKALPPEKALYALLAGTGLRIGEALTLRVGPDDGRGSFWVPETATLIIRTTLSGGGIQNSTKTLAGNRQVDLHPKLNTFLCHLLLNCKLPRFGLLFPSGTGATACVKTCYQRLAKAGIPEGFHAFRRFRCTHLETVGVPRGLAMFWTGHGPKDAHEGYFRMGENLGVRKDWAQKAGLGFELEAL